jgi:hypothetical protein
MYFVFCIKLAMYSNMVSIVISYKIVKIKEKVTMLLCLMHIVVQKVRILCCV